MNNKKFYKRGECLAVLTALAATGLVANQNVKADATSTNNNQQAISQTTSDQAQAKLNQAGQQVADAETTVNDAQSKVNDAQSAVNDAQSVADQLQTAIKQNQQTVNEQTQAVQDAQQAVNNAQQTADAATPSAIQNAQNQVSQQTSQVASDQSSVNTAQGNVADAQKAVDQANDQASQAQTAVNNQQNVVANAQQELTKAQTNANVSQSQVQNALANAQEAVKQQQQAVDSATTDLKNKQDAEATASSNLKTATEQQATAEEAFKNAQADQSAAQSAVNDQQEAVNQKQSAKEAARSALTEANNAASAARANIKSAQDQLTTAKTMPSTTTENAATFFQSIINSSTASAGEKYDAQVAYNLITGTGTFQGKSAPSWYKQAVHLGQKGDATSLAEMKKVLPIYSQYVKMREENGLSVPKISLTAVAIAMLSADYQNTLSSNVPLAHPEYYYDAENLAEDSISDSMRAWMAEKSTWDKAVAANPSLAQLKNHAYQVSVKDPALYEEVGHYLNFIDESPMCYGFASMDNARAEYVSWESEVWNDNSIGYMTGYYSVADYTNLVNNYINSVAAANDSSDQEAVANAQTVLAKAQSQMKAANNNVSAKETALNSASSDLEEAQSTLTQLQSTLATKNTVLSNAQASLKSAMQNVTAMQTALKSASAAVTAAQEQLTNAQTALSNAQAAEQTAQTAVNDFNESAATKQQAVKTAQSNLDAAQAKLAQMQSSLKDAQASQQAAVNSLTACEQKLAAAKQNLSTDQSSLAQSKTLLTELQNAETYLQAAKKALQQKQAALQKTQDQLKQNQEKSTKQAVVVLAAIRSLSAAKDQLGTAQQKLNTAKANYQQAYNAVWTDAKKYGDKISLKPLTMTAGASLPTPQIANAMAAETTTPADNAFMMLAYDPTVRIPYGTTASWVDLAKVKADAQTPGDYMEDILISFPDGTSVVLHAPLHVTAKQAAVSANDLSNVQLNDGYQIKGTQIVNAEGQPVSGWYIQDGAVYDQQGNLIGTVSSISTAASVEQGSTIPAVQLATPQVGQAPSQKNQLPQTGNNDSVILTLMGSLLAMGAGLFGLRKKQD